MTPDFLDLLRALLAADARFMISCFRTSGQLLGLRILRTSQPWNDSSASSSAEPPASPQPTPSKRKNAEPAFANSASSLFGCAGPIHSMHHEVSLEVRLHLSA